MNKKISLGAAIAFMLIVATAAFSMTMIYATNVFNQKVVSLKERENQFEKFSEIDRTARQRYFGTINETLLLDNVARGYLSGLGDPHAAYIDALTYDKMLRSQEGQIAGIGAVMVSNEDGYLTVTQVYPDSPAQAAGIEVGDVIIKIDDDDLTPENSAQMLESVTGEAGTQITMVVRKGTEDVTLDAMTRRQVVIPSVHAQMVEGTETAYIWIEEFNDNTSNQFNSELQRMINAGARSLIFDLRDNSGGVLRQAARILDRLCPSGVIATFSDESLVPYTSDPNEITLPMVVLVNGGSASSSELFAQVLREYGKAYIVGTTTVGKGTVQEIIPLSDGSAISITVAEMFTSTGESFNGEGVRPDYEVVLPPDSDWRSMELSYDEQFIKALEVAQGMQRNEEAAQSGESQAEDPSEASEQSSQVEQSQEESSQPEESGEESGDESGADESSGEDEDASSEDEEQSDENESSEEE